MKIFLENGPIRPGDYLTSSATKPGYAMKATGAGQVIGIALSSFPLPLGEGQGEGGQGSTSPAASGTLSLPGEEIPPTVMVFINIHYWVPSVAELIQAVDSGSGAGMTQGNDTFLTDLSNLNMTNASVFGDLAVRDNLYVQKDLRVKGVVYAAELKVDTITAKKLCLDDICITRDELKRLLRKHSAIAQ